MCGRYVNSHSGAELAELFDAAPDDLGAAIHPDFNVAPTHMVPAVVAASPRRTLTAFQWGLVPSWAKDPHIGSKMINARLETVDTKPSFRRAFKSDRCLLPADGFYEWTAPESGRRKQPWWIHPADGSVLAFAGIFESWRDPSSQDVLRTAAILTTEVALAAGRVHERMPVLVTPDLWDVWLDPNFHDTDHLHRILVPPAPGFLQEVKVSPAVSSVANNGPELLTPLH